jgi:hypothetical protein
MYEKYRAKLAELKLALGPPPGSMLKHRLVGAGVGALGGGLLGRYGLDTTSRTPAGQAAQRNDNTLGGAIMGGMTGLMAGDMIGTARHMSHAHQRSMENMEHMFRGQKERMNDWGRQNRYDWESHFRDAGRSRARPASSGQAFNFTPHDPQRHGSMGKVWQAVQGSAEMHDPAKRQAANAFMQSVGTPNANVDELRQHMGHFGPDTATGQMMNVLFNKHHGGMPKAASLRAEMTLLARFDAFAKFASVRGALIGAGVGTGLGAAHGYYANKNYPGEAGNPLATTMAGYGIAGGLVGGLNGHLFSGTSDFFEPKFKPTQALIGGGIGAGIGALTGATVPESELEYIGRTRGEHALKSGLMSGAIGALFGGFLRRPGGGGGGGGDDGAPPIFPGPDGPSHQLGDGRDRLNMHDFMGQRSKVTT